MGFSKIKEEIIKLLENNLVEKALGRLTDICEAKDVVLLRQNYNALVDKKINKLISQENYDIGISGITKSILGLLKKYEKQQTPKVAVQQTPSLKLEDAHLPFVLEDLQQQLALNNRRTDLAKQMLQMNGLFDNLYDEHLFKIKEGRVYKKEFDPKNFINSLFDEILYGNTKDMERSFVGSLRIRTKLDILQVRDDKKAFRYWERSVIVSGLTLALAIEFDLEKTNLLIDFVNDREQFVWKKALVGLFLVLSKNEEDVKKDKHLRRKLKNLRTQPDVQDAMTRIGLALETLEEDIKEMTKFSSGVKLHDYEDFFEAPQHWFIPFYENNAILEKSGIGEPLKSLLQDSTLLHVDYYKYFFCKNFKSYTKCQEVQFIEILYGEQKLFHTVYLYLTSSDNPMKLAKLESEARTYLRQLFYFSYTYPKGVFKSLIERKIHFYTDSVAQLISTSETLKNTKAKACNNTGFAHYQKGEYYKAIEAYKKAIEIKPDEHEAFHGLGTAYDKNGEYCKAIEAYKKAIEIKPDKYETHNSLGIAYDENGEYYKAIEAYKKAIKIRPDKYEAFYNMGNSHRNKGELYYAIEAYKKAVELKPDKHEAYHGLGYAYDSNGEFNKAIEAYKKAIELKPNYSSAYMSIGFHYLTLGDLSNAEKYLTQSITLGSKDLGNMNMGHVHLAQKREAEALACYRISLHAFKNKDTFWKGMEGDFQHLEQYGITKEYYNSVLAKIEEK